MDVYPVGKGVVDSWREFENEIQYDRALIRRDSRFSFAGEVYAEMARACSSETFEESAGIETLVREEDALEVAQLAVRFSCRVSEIVENSAPGRWPWPEAEEPLLFKLLSAVETVKARHAAINSGNSEVRNG
jgi:hypothetical protein